VILHEDGEVIATSQTGRAEEVSDFIHPRPHPPVGEGLARTRHDDSRLVGVGFEAMTELHGGLPNLIYIHIYIHTYYVRALASAKLKRPPQRRSATAAPDVRTRAIADIHNLSCTTFLLSGPDQSCLLTQLALLSSPR
jgi:hypothetical protein